MFKTIIHLNHTLHDVQKFNYLKAQLPGDAARVIQGFPITSANYKHSIDLLIERFGQQQKIVNAHMQRLLDLPKPDTGLISLQLFYDTIENHIRGLASLGQSKDSYGALLIPIILGKLPAEVRRNLAREHHTLEWSIDQLRDALLKEIKILEAGLHIDKTKSELSPAHTATAAFHTGSGGDNYSEKKSR